MGNSTKIAIVDNAWTLVASGESKGLVTLESLQTAKYRESDSLPGAGDYDGHTLLNNNEPYFRYNLLAGQNVYMRAIGASGNVEVTPD